MVNEYSLAAVPQMLDMTDMVKTAAMFLKGMAAGWLACMAWNKYG